MLKCIDPKARGTWKHPEEDTVFTFRAMAGPTAVLSRGAGAAEMMNYYLDKCITSVTNVEIGGKEYKEWKGNPVVKWSEVLPTPIANVLFVEISKFSRVTEAEESD